MGLNTISIISIKCTWTMMIGPPFGKSRGLRTEKSLVYQDLTAAM